MRQEQERFTDLVEYAPIGFYSVDEEGRFLFVNATLAAWLGLSAEDVAAGKVRLHQVVARPLPAGTRPYDRSEEHTSELQSLMRISYAVFCLKKKKKDAQKNRHNKMTN